MPVVETLITRFAIFNRRTLIKEGLVKGVEGTRSPASFRGVIGSDNAGGRMMSSGDVGNADQWKSHLYVCDANGDDSTADGTAKKPFKTLQGAVGLMGGILSRTVYARKSAESEFELVPKTTLKKAVKAWQISARKKQASLKLSENAPAVSGGDSNGHSKDEIVNDLVNDPSLPDPVETSISNVPNLIGKRVVIKGWINRLRSHANLVFIVLRNNGSYIQCVVSGDAVNTKTVQSLALETSVYVYGNVKKVPEGKSAPGGVELAVDYLDVVGLAPTDADAFSNQLNAEAGPEVLYDQRHLVIRGNNASSILRFRAKFMKYSRQFFELNNVVEITPPTLVKTQTEGGSTLFPLNYYGDTVYLTQSSQFYLEAALPAIGDCYCITSSYRAEVSNTRRHLSEYTHLEAELAFSEFDDLMDFIEKLVVYVAQCLVDDEEASLVLKAKNPGFTVPKLPFLRMNYADAIAWLNTNEIKKKVVSDDGSETEADYVFGDDIPESAERKMIDTIARPTFLYGFPAEIKAFYMRKIPTDERITESCDLLMPNVGEIVGGSSRITDYAELMAAYKSVGIDPTPYYWYTDQRKYGTVPHCGFGLGVERLIAWILNLYTVREACLFPRYVGRCVP